MSMMMQNMGVWNISKFRQKTVENNFSYVMDESLNGISHMVYYGIWELHW